MMGAEAADTAAAANTVVLASVGESFQNAVASGPLLLAIGAALLAGLISFASPCVVPLVPGYLAYLTSIGAPEKAPAGAATSATVTATGTQQDTATAIQTKSLRWRVTGAALLFVAGFTVVFVLLSAVVLGAIQYLAPQQELLQRVGGVITILMGLVFIGLVPALQKDTRMQPKAISTWLGAPLLGGVFVGDISLYSQLRPLTGRALGADPSALIAPAGAGAMPDTELPDDAVHWTGVDPKPSASFEHTWIKLPQDAAHEIERDIVRMLAQRQHAWIHAV